MKTLLTLLLTQNAIAGSFPSGKTATEEQTCQSEYTDVLREGACLSSEFLARRQLTDARDLEDLRNFDITKFGILKTKDGKKVLSHDTRNEVLEEETGIIFSYDIRTGEVISVDEPKGIASGSLFGVGHYVKGHPKKMGHKCKLYDGWGNECVDPETGARYIYSLDSKRIEQSFPSEGIAGRTHFAIGEYIPKGNEKDLGFEFVASRGDYLIYLKEEDGTVVHIGDFDRRIEALSVPTEIDRLVKGAYLTPEFRATTRFLGCIEGLGGANLPEIDQECKSPNNIAVLDYDGRKLAYDPFQARLLKVYSGE